MSWLAAGSQILGSLINANQAESSDDASMDIARKNIELQREFAQNGIRWKVEDAKNAGIHPLFALGANTTSFSPVHVGASPSNDWANTLGAAGDNISRAIDATRTPEERVATRAETLSLERAELENDLLRSQIAVSNAQLNPAMPSLNQDASFPEATSDLLKIGIKGSSRVTDKPLERTISDYGFSGHEPGVLPDVGWVRTPTGVAPVPSKDVKERIEDQFIPEMMWSLRNNLIPSFDGGKPPPLEWLPPGAVQWRYSGWKQEWQPEYEMEDVFNKWGFKITRPRATPERR